MAFKVNQIVVANQPIEDTTPTTTPTPAADNQLSVQELAFLLGILKQATITGDQVQFIYNLILKLQNQYVVQTS